MSTTNKVAAITGAAGGIGRAIAERLCRDGYSVVLCDIDKAGLADTAAALSVNGKVFAQIVDVTDQSSVAAALAAVEQQFGRLDALINAAGIMGMVDNKLPSMLDMPMPVWHRVLNVNLTGPFMMCKAALPLMRRGTAGRIVNVASRAARIGTGDAAYAASKGGLVTLSRNLARELGRYGITVNCIAPSWVDTPLTRALGGSQKPASVKYSETPLGRMGTVMDMAGAVAFLVSEDASFITGTVLDVNGGASMY